MQTESLPAHGIQAFCNGMVFLASFSEKIFRLSCCHCLSKRVPKIFYLTSLLQRCIFCPDTFDKSWGWRFDVPTKVSRFPSQDSVLCEIDIIIKEARCNWVLSEFAQVILSIFRQAASISSLKPIFLSSEQGFRFLRIGTDAYHLRWRLIGQEILQHTYPLNDKETLLCPTRRLPQQPPSM